MSVCVNDKIHTKSIFANKKQEGIKCDKSPIYPQILIKDNGIQYQNRNNTIKEQKGKFTSLDKSRKQIG